MYPLVVVGMHAFCEIKTSIGGYTCILCDVVVSSGVNACSLGNIHLVGL